MDNQCNHSKAEKRVLVTGASGFVGRHLLEYLSSTKKDWHIRSVIRSNPSPLQNHKQLKQKNIDQVLIKTNFAETNWAKSLKQCDTIIHLAARVHVMKETDPNPWNAYYQTNVLGTLNLARQAAELGVKRFIYLSTIKVNGEMTPLGSPYKADDPVFPEDFYAKSKYQAEQALFDLSLKTGMQVIVIRPPLVYGQGVKGNFETMIRWLKKGYPLPLRSINNKRSFISVYNLVDLITHCIEHPSKENHLFLASDGEDLSTSMLFEKLAKSMNKKTVLIPFPSLLLKTAAACLGKKGMIQRLFGSLQIDIKKTQTTLGWEPRMTMEQALRKDFAENSVLD